VKRAYTILLLLAAFGAAACQPADDVTLPEESAAPAPSEDGDWTVLFDGSSIEGWNQIGDANWSLDPSDGSVMANMGSGFLVTPESYRDFELEVEFWVDEPANSGVFFRASDPTTINDQNAYEANLILFCSFPSQAFSRFFPPHNSKPH